MVTVLADKAMDLDRAYNLRSSSVKADRRGARHSTQHTETTTTSTLMMSASSTSRDAGSVNDSVSTSSVTTSYGIRTPEPVQRTLYTDETEDEDEEEEEYIEEEEDNDGEDTTSRTERFGVISRRVRHVNDEDDDDDEEEEKENYMLQRRSKKKKAGGAGFFKRRAATMTFFRRLGAWFHVFNIGQYARKFWQFVLRNSFMAMNVLWLLAPLGCFLIAILVPQYLTTAIRYVDILTTTAMGTQSSVGSFEKGTMRSIVQEIVDVKLSTMNEEISFLRKTMESQEREMEALRLLHESLRHVHEEQQKKFSLANSDSAISVHIERIVSKHTEELWEKVLEKTSQTEATLRTITNHQATLSSTIKDHQEEIDAIRNLAIEAVSSGQAGEYVHEREIRKEFNEWKLSFQQELQTELQREVHEVENRMSKALLTEKQLLFDSVESLHNMNAANPALVNLIEDALVVADTRRMGRVDYAALANGAVVVRSERDLLFPNDYSPFQYFTQLIGLGFSGSHDTFTSQSYRNAPLQILGLLTSSCEIPRWLSRHNGRPETALSETMEIGSCWGIPGSSGRLSVKFAKRIIVDAITIDHIPEQVASDFGSAPYEFRILGLSGDRVRETVDFIPFGNFSYGRNGQPTQTFKLTSPISQRTPIDGVTLEINSNHGHPEFTCLYRFRVHGRTV